jgi:hypothetical protein
MLQPCSPTPCTLKRYQLDPSGRAQLRLLGYYILVCDDVTKVTGDLHPALLTICTISHTEASLQSLTRAAHFQAGPVTETMLRSMMTLLRGCLFVVVGRLFHFHLHITKFCHDNTWACLAFADGTRQSSPPAEPINHSFVVREVDFVVHRSLLSSDKGCER